MMSWGGASALRGMDLFQQWARRTAPTRPSYGWSDLRGDVTGGLAASALAIPTALSFGELSGLGPVAGLYGALVLGVVGALGGNTRGIVSGPSTGTTVIMALVVAQYTHSIGEALVAAILAGLIQTLFGLLRFGRYISYVPSAVINGFLMGVGLLLIITQIAPATGVGNVGGGVFGSLRALPFTIAHANLDAVIITAICLTIAFLWRGRLNRLVPSYLMLVMTGTLVGVFWLTGAPTVGEISVGLPTVRWPEFSGEFVLRIVEPTFMIAMVSSLDVLASAVAVDSITGRRQQANRLLAAHGVGNIAAGLVGGLPGSVSGGTLVNVYAGGKTFVSNLIVAAIALLTLVSGLSLVVEVIPRALLAAILIATGWRLIDWRMFRRFRHLPLSVWSVTGLTVLLILFVDVLTGMVIGFVIGILVSSRHLGAFEVTKLLSVPLLDRVILGYDADAADPFNAKASMVRFPDRISVASARDISRIVERDLEEHPLVVIFDLSLTEYIDDTGAMALDGLINMAAARGGPEIVISGMKAGVAETMDSLGLLGGLPADRIVADLEAAKRVARPIVEADIAGELSAESR